MAAYDLSDRVALVTGAARGIGFETARGLYARGASVALVDLDLAETGAAAARIDAERAIGLAADVSDRLAIEDAVARTAERFGGLDVVVANAGIAPPLATMRAIDPDVQERVIEVDLLGVWRTVRAALPMVVQRRGHVVVVASVYAFMNGMGMSSYAMSKAAVEQLGRALRVELKPHGASASVAYFGFIDTDMVRDALEDRTAATRLEQSVPRFVTRRLSPRAAGQAIVRGIERRAPRIVAPGWWRAMSVMRGVINPLLDAQMERDARALELVLEADAREGAVLERGAARAVRTR